MSDSDVCKITVATFNKFATKYADKYFDLTLYDSYLKHFCSYLDEANSQILDIACGPGNLAAFISREFPKFKVTGIDLAPAMIEQARMRVPSAKFLVEDCRKMESLEQVFDGALFSFGLCYLNDSDMHLFFSSLNQVLKPSAPFYLSTMTGSHLQSGLDVSSSGDQVYIEYRSSEEVLEVVKKAGFNILFSEHIPSPSNTTNKTNDLVLIAQRISV
ncbi:MAG: class I SAM-dependent methyltransferase [Methylophilaceae bacterium]